MEKFGRNSLDVITILHGEVGALVGFKYIDGLDVRDHDEYRA